MRARPAALGYLPTFNRWLCVMRLRAAGGVLAFALVLHAAGSVDISVAGVAAVCSTLVVVSLLGLRSRSLERVPRLYFHLQNLVDIVGISTGIAVSSHGLPALLFRPLYALVIVPA